MWSSIADVALAPDNHLYVAGSPARSQRGALWCLGPDLCARWTTDLADLAQPMLALHASGDRIYAARGKGTIGVFVAATGAVMPRIRTELDVAWLRADVDGTLVALVGGRLLRLASDGTIREAICADLPAQARFHLGWDGRIYAATSGHVACFGGYRSELRLDVVDDIASDGSGRIHVLGRVGTNRIIAVVASDGSSVHAVASGGVLGDETILRVARDGTMFLLGNNGAVRVLERSGRLTWQNASARVA